MIYTNFIQTYSSVQSIQKCTWTRSCFILIATPVTCSNSFLEIHARIKSLAFIASVRSYEVRIQITAMELKALPKATQKYAKDTITYEALNMFPNDGEVPLNSNETICWRNSKTNNV